MDDGGSESLVEAFRDRFRILEGPSDGPNVC
jgi:hypothetical protein